MGVINASAAAATAVVGYDLLTGNKLKRTAYRRVITGIGFTGSAAAGDCKASLYADTVLIGEFYNTDTGVPNNDDIVDILLDVPAHTELIMEVTDAAGTNPVFVTIRTEDMI